MAIRRVKQHSDRGSIKDLKDSPALEAKPQASELRFKKLYEFAQKTKNNNLQSALGIITTDYIEDKNAMPLIVYRIRKIVEDIKSKSAGRIEILQNQFIQCFEPLSSEAQEYFRIRKMVKTASSTKPPVFRRVS